jgi:hypothetical protein
MCDRFIVVKRKDKKMIDFKFCEIDSNYVPVVEVEGEFACQYCYEAYGEIN